MDYTQTFDERAELFVDKPYRYSDIPINSQKKINGLLGILASKTIQGKLKWKPDMTKALHPLTSSFCSLNVAVRFYLEMAKLYFRCGSDSPWDVIVIDLRTEGLAGRYVDELRQAIQSSIEKAENILDRLIEQVEEL